MNERYARWLLGLGLPVTVLACGYGPLIVYQSELPARLASHFTLAGVADDSMTIFGFAATFGVMISLGLAACVALAVGRRPLQGGVAPFIGFLGAFISSLGAGIVAWTSISQRGLVRWEEAHGAGWPLLGLVGAALTIGATGAYLASSLPTAADSSAAAEATPAMALASGERAVWHRTLHNRWFLGLGLFFVAGSIVTALFTHWGYASASLLVGLIVLTLSGIRTRVDRHGLYVGYGPLPWPKTHIAIERITSASAIDVRPMEWGGWGYRGSLTLMKRAAVVLRAGPGLRLDLNGGKVFVVTVDDPETPAALLNAEVQRLR